MKHNKVSALICLIDWIINKNDIKHFCVYNNIEIGGLVGEMTRRLPKNYYPNIKLKAKQSSLYVLPWWVIATVLLGDRKGLYLRFSTKKGCKCFHLGKQTQLMSLVEVVFIDFQRATCLFSFFYRSTLRRIGFHNSVLVEVNKSRPIIRKLLQWSRMRPLWRPNTSF